MQSLFAAEVGRAELEDSLEYFRGEESPSRAVLDFSRRLAGGAFTHRAEIDEKIKGHLRNWNLSRLGNVEKSILRIAVFELLFCPDIPPRVTINEAVELGKEFATSRSVRFINGILDRIAREVPAKVARLSRATPELEEPSSP